MFTRIFSRADARKKSFLTIDEEKGLDPQINRLDTTRAQSIVNQYGKALEKANTLNRLAVIHLIDQMASDDKLREEVNDSLTKKTGRYYDLFSSKCCSSLLPYPKETIRKAIELLLEHDKDPDNIHLLREGLRYLEYFE